MDPLMSIAVIFSFLNAALLVALLVVFLGIAMRSRAAHSVGLMFFALLLLANSLLTAFSYVMMAPLFGKGALPWLDVIAVLEFVGLAVLLKITL
jgi:hypothetical protein